MRRGVAPLPAAGGVAARHFGAVHAGGQSGARGEAHQGRSVAPPGSVGHGFGFRLPAVDSVLVAGRCVGARRRHAVPLPGVPELLAGAARVRPAQRRRLLGGQQVSGHAHFAPADRQRSARPSRLLRSLHPLQVSFS